MLIAMSLKVRIKSKSQFKRWPNDLSMVAIKKATRLNAEHQSVQISPIFKFYSEAFTFFLGCARYQIFQLQLLQLLVVFCMHLTVKMFLHGLTSGRSRWVSGVLTETPLNLAQWKS